MFIIINSILIIQCKHSSIVVDQKFLYKLASIQRVVYLHWQAQCLLCRGLHGLQISHSKKKADTTSSQKNFYKT